MTAVDPKRSLTSSSAASSASLPCGSNGSLELDGAAVVEVRDRDSDECQAALLDQRRGDREQPSCGRQDLVRARGRMRQRVRAARPGEVVEAQTEHDGAADSTRSSHPARDAVDECHE